MRSSGCTHSVRRLLGLGLGLDDTLGAGLPWIGRRLDLARRVATDGGYLGSPVLDHDGVSADLEGRPSLGTQRIAVGH